MITAREHRAAMARYGIGALLAAPSSNAKTAKSDKAELGYETRIMYLAPVTEAGFGNVCPKASPGCAAACLFTAGRGGMNSVRMARVRKTRFYFTDRPLFLACLEFELARAKRRTDRLGKRLAVRLNGTSDIVWERIAPALFARFEDVQFYDYTKIAQRFAPSWNRPANYHLTFSRSETAANSLECAQVRAWGGNVCAVYSGSMPADWHDADATDLRFLDPADTWVGVSAKGSAKSDTSGFVLHYGSQS